MSRLASRFNTLKHAGRAALIPYITAGDPSPEATVSLMHALVDGGADVIELGAPFTDPMADGPVIQAACERALSAGTTLSRVLDTVATFRGDDPDTPIVLMGYLNPMDAMGLTNFAQRAVEAGVDGILIVDMTTEEAPETLPILAVAGLDPICLVAPTTTDDRIRRICQSAAGFVYYVSTKGVTGGSGIDAGRLADQLARIRPHTELPIGVGFGVREPADAAAVAEVADAVVVGSVLVRVISEHDGSLEATCGRLRAQVAALKQGMESSNNLSVAAQ